MFQFEQQMRRGSELQWLDLKRVNQDMRNTEQKLMRVVASAVKILRISLWRKPVKRPR